MADQLSTLEGLKRDAERKNNLLGQQNADLKEEMKRAMLMNNAISANKDKKLKELQAMNKANDDIIKKLQQKLKDQQQELSKDKDELQSLKLAKNPLQSYDTSSGQPYVVIQTPNG